MRTIPEIKEGTSRLKASGVLPNGKPVIVNADGTVSVVAETPVSESIGTPAVFNNANTLGGVAITFDSNSNRTVNVVRDTFGTGRAYVGTVSGNSVSYGSVVTWSSKPYYLAATFDSNSNKVVIAYADQNNSFHGYAVVGEVSGTSISFGTPVRFEPASLTFLSITFDSISNKVVIAYNDNGNSSFGTAVVGTVSNTTISFGTPVVFDSSSTADLSATFDSTSGKVVIAYKSTGNSNYGAGIVGSISGTSISFGNDTIFETVASSLFSASFDSNSNKVIIGYVTSTGRAVVGTVSNTSISFGATAEFTNRSVPSNVKIVFDANAQKPVVFFAGPYTDGVVNQFYLVATVSGTGLSFGSETTLSGLINDPFEMDATFVNSSNKIVSVYRDRLNSSNGTSQVMSPAYDSPNLTSENYIGMSQGGSVASGSSGTVDIIGSLSTNQSGLTPGQSYYVQVDGTIGETAGTPSVFAGTALSATSLVVKT